jgi:hypothetical protein
MSLNEKKCEILADLFQINRDCTSDYRKMMQSFKTNPKVAPLLEQLVNTESNFLLEIRRQVDTYLGDPADAVQRRGEIYKAWEGEVETRDTAGVSETPDNKEVFVFCQKRIKAVNHAYDRAMRYGIEFSDNVKEMLKDHLTRLRVLVPFQLNSSSR